jgi:Carboxypeptidase regulatory-like domain/TonB-dependent Receptor Plug Domain
MSAFRFRFPRVLLTFAVLVLIAGSAFAQATTTGAISGTVTTSDGNAIPGVTVSVSSPSLQGTRTTYSGDNGDFLVRGLPPGRYAVEFTMEGMATSRRNTSVELGQTTKVDSTMSLSATSEAITVTADAPTLLTTTQLGTNLDSDEIQELPIPRGAGFLAAIASLTPGVTQNTFNAGQVRINGAFGYDNVFLVDGTDVNDNLFGTAHNLYIEDAIAETQVMTGGVSAEYGRFTGGVVNVVTKNGGNEFHGSARADVTNSAWRDETPVETTQRLDKNNYIYSGTLGGPVLRDRLWFFAAGRQEKTDTSNNLPITNIPYVFGVENPRWEGKLTATVANQTFQVSYLDNETTQANNIGLAGRTMDPRAFVTRTLPNTRKAAFYNGIITPNLFAEVKYSEKIFGFRNTGGTSSDIHDSPFLTRSHSPSRHFNAPFFDSSDPEDRNNKDLTAAASYFLSTRRTGTHDFKSGWERYTSTRVGGNSQSSTGYVINANYKTANGTPTGTPVTDPQGRFIPVFLPVGTPAATGPISTMVNWIPVRGAQVDLETDAFFITDSWTINKRFTANIGGRYETTDGQATGNIPTVSASRFTPRLALAIDPMANGKYKVDLTYAEYAGKFSERQFAVNTNVGTPNNISYRYIGPPGEGIDFAPGFNLANWEITDASFPLKNVFVDNDIVSPVAKEWTISGGTALGRSGFGKLTYTTREWSDFWEDFIGIDRGFTEFEVNGVKKVFDNTFYGNTNDMYRKYSAIQLLSQFRFFNRWTLHGNYTYELENEGNFVGEAGNQPGNPSVFGNRPEMLDPARHFPGGRLPGFQQHRLRLLNNYELGLGRAGNLDVGVVYNYDSAQTYSLQATGVTLTTIQRDKLTAAGYKNLPTSQTVFFGDLGSEEFNPIHSFDLALTYSVPIIRNVSPRIKFEVYNVTNEQELRFFDTTVTAAAGSPVDGLGLPTTYTRGANFGKARDANDYQTPREYRVSASFTF